MSCARYDSDFVPEWCPGCGNFDILACVKEALCQLFDPREVIVVAGIGQAAKLGFSVRANMFNGLHGRTLPLATGMQMANHRARILVVGGDGDMFSEGGNHLIHAMRRNLDVTVLAGDNRVYGLTKGQGAPTSRHDFRPRIHKDGAAPVPINPVMLGLGAGATFVARAYSGNQEELIELIKQGMQHRGAALIDIMFPCVSFNTINTAAWYKKRVKPIAADHDPTDMEAAMRLAGRPEDEIPTGVYYQVQRPVFSDHFEALAGESLVQRVRDWSPERIRGLFDQFR
jgi:2-oxoglutarate ferredoxin oxidoreductase subunit beta